MPLMFEDRKAYSIAERKAVEELSHLEPGDIAAMKGVTFESGSSVFTVPFMDGAVKVAFRGGEVSGREGERLSGAVAVLALHYLVYRGEPLRGIGWLAYRDMPGARQFASAFEEMAERRLAAHFDSAPEELATAALSLGGRPSDLAPHSFLVQAFPRVSLMVVLWPADEEGAGSAKFLFQPGVTCYFHSEDLAALGIVVAERLIERSEPRI